MNSSTDMFFTPESKNIEQIFGDRDAFYQMPIYQRPYSWDEERVEQLWSDILEAYENNVEDDSIDQNYFLGSLIVVKKGSDAYEVVDGQQRLTTLTILFCVIRDLCSKQLNDKQNNIIMDSIKDLRDKKERLKLTTHLNNQSIFDETILKVVKFDASKQDLRDNRFLQMAFCFRDLIKKSQNSEDEHYLEKFNDFIDYLFFKTKMIRVICYEESFAIKLFTVLNDRGLDLSPTDIIKAYLLQTLDESKRDGFIEVYKQIETIAKGINESLVSIFTLYLYYLKGANPKRALQDELKEQFKNQDSQTIILDIKKFTYNILEINGKSKDKDISMLKHLPQTNYWKSILATAKQIEYSNYEKLKSLITKYYYQSWIAGGTANRIKQTSFNILKKVKSNASIDDIKNIISENLKKYPAYLDFLSNENVYWFKWHKPVLLSIEYYQQDDREYIPISNDLHTEHILPKEWQKKDLNWKDNFSPETASKIINSLGNLTLLSGTKNIMASNNDYNKKREIYKGNGGKGFDGKTSFEITKRILDDYEIWNEENIKHRYDWLIGEIKKILEIN